MELLHTDHRQPDQFRTMHALLLQSIKASDDVYDFASHICKEQIDTPLYQVISNLLNSGNNLHTLLTALSSCEEHQLEHAFDKATALSAEEQLSSAKKIIRHFNAIQDLLLATAESYFENRAELKKEGIQFTPFIANNNDSQKSGATKSYQEIIRDSINMWSKNQNITLRNYYNGLTIHANATFITGKDEGEIQVKLNEEVARVFAIHPSQLDAFALCEGQEIQVRLSVKSVANQILTLRLGKTFPVHSETRKHICIQIQEQVPVTISMDRKQQLHARLHDISARGLGIDVYGISKAPYNVGDQVKCELTLNRTEVVLEGIVRWASSIDDEARIGIELINDSETEEIVEKEVFRLQRDIINATNQMPIPEILKKELG